MTRISCRGSALYLTRIDVFLGKARSSEPELVIASCILSYQHIREQAVSFLSVRGSDRGIQLNTRL